MKDIIPKNLKQKFDGGCKPLTMGDLQALIKFWRKQHSGFTTLLKPGGRWFNREGMPQSILDLDNFSRGRTASDKLSTVQLEKLNKIISQRKARNSYSTQNPNSLPSRVFRQIEEDYNFVVNDEGKLVANDKPDETSEDVGTDLTMGDLQALTKLWREKHSMFTTLFKPGGRWFNRYGMPQSMLDLDNLSRGKAASERLTENELGELRGIVRRRNTRNSFSTKNFNSHSSQIFRILEEHQSINLEKAIFVEDKESFCKRLQNFDDYIDNDENESEVFFKKNWIMISKTLRYINDNRETIFSRYKNYFEGARDVGNYTPLGGKPIHQDAPKSAKQTPYTMLRNLLGLIHQVLSAFEYAIGPEFNKPQTFFRKVLGAACIEGSTESVRNWYEEKMINTIKPAGEILTPILNSYALADQDISTERAFELLVKECLGLPCQKFSGHTEEVITRKMIYDYLTNEDYFMEYDRSDSIEQALGIKSAATLSS